MEDLRWEVEQKEREIETLKQQLDMSEQRSHKELEGIQVVLQVILVEILMLNWYCCRGIIKYFYCLKAFYTDTFLILLLINFYS